MKLYSLFSLACATTALASSSLQSLATRQTNWTIGQTVQTNSGPVSGHPAKNDSQVSEYLGIPFGQAPVGDLRFAAPVSFKGSKPLNGSSFVSPLEMNAVQALTGHRVHRVPSHQARILLLLKQI